MKKVIKGSGSTFSPRKQAQIVLDKLKDAYDAMETMSDEAFQQYIPEGILDDLDSMIREIDLELGM